MALASVNQGLGMNTQDRYAGEKIPINEFSDAATLYDALALTFCQWVERNPTGVVCIAPTLQFTQFFSEVAKLLKASVPIRLLSPKARFAQGERKNVLIVRGERSKAKSNPYEQTGLSKLTFIQPYEVLGSGRSYAALTKRFMIDQWNLRQEQLYLINDAKTPETYNTLISNLGGIGLSILPLSIDGNVGFINLENRSTQTTLATMDYTTSAICAHDLGGIQHTLDKKLFALGSALFFAHPSTTMIIVATGSNKAEALATLAKQNIPNARVYTTTPTTQLLAQRFYSGLATKDAQKRYAITHLMNTVINKENLDPGLRRGDLMDVVNSHTEHLVSDNHMSYRRRPVSKPLDSNSSLETLSPAIYNQDPILNKYPQKELTIAALSHLEEAIKRGQEPLTHKKFLHTSPHHDDIALGYLPLIKNLIGSGNTHTIATMTSGANAVPDSLLFSMLDSALHDSIKSNPDLMFFLKGCLREWEDERFWHHIGIEKENVHHLRLGFYHGPKAPSGFSYEHDIVPVYRLLEATMPDIITMAKDPEDSGPETHTKVLKIIRQAVALFLKNYPDQKLEIWGYRNVWNTFHPSETNIIIPVTNDELELLQSSFKTFYQSQVNAQFPYALHQGPFCDISADTMIKNLARLKELLGEKHPLIKATNMKNATGAIFMQVSDVRNFL